LCIVCSLKDQFPGRGELSAGQQAGHQAAALVVSLAMAIIGGVVTGAWPPSADSFIVFSCSLYLPSFPLSFSINACLHLLYLLLATFLKAMYFFLHFVQLSLFIPFKAAVPKILKHAQHE